MKAAIQEFVGLLRNSGLRVSSAELLDALRAVELLGYDEPSVLDDALAPLLVKREADRESYDMLFQLYFRGGRELAARGVDAPLFQWLDQSGMSEEMRARFTELLAAELAEMQAMGRLAMGAEQPDIASLVELAGLSVDLQNMRSPLQAGFYGYRMLDKLGFDGAEKAASSLARRLAEHLPPELGDELVGLVSKRGRELRQEFRAYVQRQYQMIELGRGSVGYGAEDLADKRLGALRREEVDAMRDEVRRLAQLLKSKMAVKRRRHQRGRLDTRRTTRRSLHTEGIPFELSFRRRPPRKARLFILCDISDSVAQVSRFMLQFSYLLQELFDGVRSFGFVAECVELSHLFQNHEIEHALDLALSGSELNLFTNSNYGTALESFASVHLQALNRRSTVLIIGDARNNYHATRSDILAEMRRRSGQLIWLNPEAPAAWGFGDSVMKEYEEHCDKVCVAYNLRSLQEVATALVEEGPWS